MPALQRAQLLHQQGRAGEAWIALAPLKAAINDNGQALRLFALVAQGAGRIDDAIAALKRIAVLEHDPPDILGAIADTYGKAERHAAAYEHWGALVRRDPTIVEGHLNRAVAAAHAGLHEEALGAADAGLVRFPSDARLLATRAMVLKNAGRTEESIQAFAIAVAADPNRALTRHNQAVALRAGYRFEEACEAFAAAERLGMKGAQFHSNWAAAALEAGRIDDSENLYRRALDEDWQHKESQKGLTRLKIEYRGGQDAFAHLERSAKQRPNHPKPWLDWANALIGNRQMAEAGAVAAQGYARNPSVAELRAISVFAQGMAGDASAALDELDSMLRGQPKESRLRNLITQIAFRAGRPERAAEILELRAATDPQDQLAWAMLSLAWRLLGDPREQWLCDYDRLVMVTDVPSADGRLSPEAYAGEMAGLLDNLHVTMAEPGDQSLRGGTQTPGALFDRPDPAIQQFRVAVTKAAERAVAALPDDPAHPFLSRKSPHFGFSGSWSVRLAADGHHVSHVHPEGWMSSAYYARLPAVDEAAEQRHEGWIRFGVPPEHLGIDLPPRRIVQPAPGRLVLFPSYMWHGTIPFKSGDRLTAAFDYQPL